MLLAIDIGNTNIGIGVFRGFGADAALAGEWRIRTDRNRTADEHGMLIKHLLEHRNITLADIHDVAISSVVPTLNETLIDVSHRYVRAVPFVVGPDTDSGIHLHYNPTSAVGADRICNAVGAFAKYGGPAIVVDFGTATTLDAIADNGDYLGGAIMPGIGISMDALYAQAARLYHVELSAPPAAIGDNTERAMQSGIVFGFAGQTDAMVDRFKAELGHKARVIATGGLADMIFKSSRTIEVVDHMVTLDGLRRLFERHAGRHAEDATDHASNSAITEREQDILTLITTGMCNKEIAHRLGIQTQTVKNHISTLLKKLKLEDRVQLAVYNLDSAAHEIQPRSRPIEQA